MRAVVADVAATVGPQARRVVLQSATPTPNPTSTPTPVPPGTLADVVPSWVLFPGWQLVVFLLVLGVGAYLSTYVVRLLGRPIARRFRRQSVAQTVLRVVRLSTVLLAAAFGANLVGFEIGDIVLSVTVFSAVVGIVLAPIVGSIVNGLFILADQPYEIGDMIELDDGTRGFVDDITLRYTKMFTLDNTFIVIPNSAIRERDVVNFSAEDERTRLSLPLLVTYESDIDEARRVMERAAQSCDDVLEGGPDIRIGSARYPAKPTCLIEEYADHGVLLNLRYWATKPYKIPSIRSRVQERIWGHLADADVEIPYPHQHLVFDETSGQAQVALDHQSSRRWQGMADAAPPAAAETPPDATPETASEAPETTDGTATDESSQRDGE